MSLDFIPCNGVGEVHKSMFGYTGPKPTQEGECGSKWGASVYWKKNEVFSDVMKFDSVDGKGNAIVSSVYHNELYKIFHKDFEKILLNEPENILFGNTVRKWKFVCKGKAIGIICVG